MNKQDFEYLIKINKDFYNQIGSEFSKTRRYPWKGWESISKIIEKSFPSDKLSLLDLGCGNGRFYKFLLERLPKHDSDYTGIDTNSELLDEAKKTHPQGQFIMQNILADLNWKNFGTYDLVVAFGFTHHIPSQEYRKTWFTNLTKLLNKDGLLIFTNWLFDIQKGISKEKEYENGDYFLGWNKYPNLYRYCHYYGDEEMVMIIKLLEETGCVLRNRFVGDSKDLNEYFVFSKL